MVFGEKEPIGKLLIDGKHLHNVEQFTYLGSNTTFTLDNMREVRTRLANATAALKAMEKVWKSRSIEIETKKRVLQTRVFSREKMLQENTMNRMDTERKEHRTEEVGGG